MNDLVRAEAVATLQKWLDGVYIPGTQRLIKLWGGNIFAVLDREGNTTDRHFRVTVSVEEVP